MSMRTTFETIMDQYKDVDGDHFDGVVIELNDFLQDLVRFKSIYKESDVAPIYHELHKAAQRGDWFNTEAIESFKILYTEFVTADERWYLDANNHLLNWELAEICHKYDSLGVSEEDIAEAGHLIEEAYR